MYAVGSCAFLGLNPFINLIQLFMGLLYFDDFVADNGMHASSPHCSNAGGLIGIDDAIAALTTFIAIFAAPVVVYSVSQVLVPINPVIIERLRQRQKNQRKE